MWYHRNCLKICGKKAGIYVIRKSTWISGERRLKMFNREDNTYNEIREKSLFQWLDEMEKHEDIAVRGGVKLTREYIQHLKDENKRLEEQNKLKNEYLKKVVGR